MNEIRIDAVYRASSEPTVGRLCNIDPALAARPLTTSIGSFDVVLEFPKVQGRLPTPGYLSWSEDETGMLTALSPAYFTAHTVFTYASGLAKPALREEMRSAVAAVRFAAARLSDALRIEQPPVGMVGELPIALSLKATDLTQGLELRAPEPLNPGYAIIAGLPALTTEAAKSALKDGVSPPRALLAQARYLTQSTNSPQPGIAVLLAAVAVETHAKQMLTASWPPGSTPSLRSLRERHRTAADLYGAIAKTVFGRSLEEEDPALWEELRALFKARNKMAHESHAPAHGEAGPHVVAAMRSMAWLN